MMITQYLLDADLEVDDARRRGARSRFCDIVAPSRSRSPRRSA